MKGRDEHLKKKNEKLRRREHGLEQQLEKHRKDLAARRVGLTGPRPRSSLDFSKPTSLAMKLKPATKAEHICCPLVNKWSKALAEGMQVADPDTKIPLPDTNEGFVAKPSVSIVNSGQFVVDAFTADDTGASFWFYPDGDHANGAGFFPTGLTYAGLPYTDYLVGANVSAVTPSIGTGPGVWGYFDSGQLENIFFAPPQPTLANPLFPMNLDPLDTVQVPSASENFANRTVKLTVEVTIISEELTIRGGIRWSNPSMWPGSEGAGGQSVLVSQTRREPTYADYPFRNSRTHTFTYFPNAESVRFGSMDTTGVTQDISLFNSRCVMQFYGMEPKNAVLVRYIWSQEYRGTRTNAISTPSPVTTDVVHLANALPAMSVYSANGKPPTLTQHVAHQKVLAHPVAKSLASAKGLDLGDVKAVANKAGSVFSDIASIGGLVAGLL